MQKRFTLVFDELMLEQLKKLGKNEKTRTILTKMLDKLELLGPRAGKLIDSKLHLYEMKAKHPPIRLYFRHHLPSDIHLFEYELKTNEKKQSRTINKIRNQGPNE